MHLVRWDVSQKLCFKNNIVINLHLGESMGGDSHSVGGHHSYLMVEEVFKASDLVTSNLSKHITPNIGIDECTDKFCDITPLVLKP